MIILGKGVALILLIGAISSCYFMLEGGLQNIVGTYYTSEDEDFISIDNDYTKLEKELQQEIDNIERKYPGSDESQ